MARLQLKSLNGGEYFIPWFNGADEAGLSIFDDPYVFVQDSKFSLSPSVIEFRDGPFWIRWEGSFRINEGRLTGGQVNAIERSWGSNVGHIRIDGFSYPISSELGSFYALSVPNEISSPLQDDPQVYEYLKASLKEGSEYLFTTAYDSNSLSTQSPQEPQESYSQSLSGMTGKADVLVFSEAPSYGAGQADVITNFRPEEGDTLSIETGLFAGASGTPRLKIAKNTKVVKKLSRSTIDFIYDKSSGYLYFNENGKGNGFGDGGVFAIIDGKISIQPANVSFI